MRAIHNTALGTATFGMLLTVLLVSATSSSFETTPNRSAEDSAQIEWMTGAGAPILNSENTDSTFTEVSASSAETTPLSVEPNESGKIMIVMFHKFAAHFYRNPRIDQPYTTSFNRFRSLLQTLYNQNYRLIGLNDFINNRIDTPPGTTPIVFTFDDATAGQFHLVKRDGEWVAAADSAVGIMEAFHEEHPDFGLEGTFYINLGNAMPVFEGGGTLAERLQYLVDKGFEIGNHTYSHVDLSKVKNARAVVREVGKNQQALYKYLPGYQMQSLALPYGRVPVWKRYALKGEFEDIPYENRILLSVGSKPTDPLSSANFVPPVASRVRAPGRFPAVTDLNYWLKNMSPESRFISDGNPNVVTVPKRHSIRPAQDFIAHSAQKIVVY
ncbi:MAG: polysaccharide deacetylase family protein [Deltaproteobacteria bacterium]|nr:polysaccharide deacetylase family protein [Deltaproteobacteria bacterium]MBN2672786.1 polysaccharide deacetylase family protein [Deltaproteobacteria bacterium]